MTEQGSHCGNCGSILTPGVKFCEVCGQPVPPTVCAQCGAHLGPGVKFCEVCGSPVGRPSAAPPLARPTHTAAPPETEWEEPATPARRPKPRKRGRGCLWILLIVVLLLIAAAVAFWAKGWVIYNGNLIFFPNGLPFVATPVP